MHEVSFVDSAVKNVCESTGGKKAKKIVFAVGELVVGAERFGELFRELSKGTVCENAEIEVLPVVSKIKCFRCGYSGRGKPTHHSAICPKCFSSQVEVSEGKDVRILKLETF